MIKLCPLKMIAPIGFLLVSLSANAFAQTKISPHYVQAAVWVDTELLAPSNERDIWWLASQYGQDFVDNLSAEQKMHFFAILSVFDEIRWILSGMVYGFWFEYTPASAADGVVEEFLLQHIGFIAAGDPNLQIVSVARAGSWLEITFQYALTTAQQQRINLQRNTGMFHAKGAARGDLAFGFESRKFVLEDSVKNAIYQQLRTMYRSRPSFVRGEVFLRNPTLLNVVRGSWQAKSDVTIRFDHRQ